MGFATWSVGCRSMGQLVAKMSLPMMLLPREVTAPPQSDGGPKRPVVLGARMVFCQLTAPPKTRIPPGPPRGGDVVV
jgi:hypothetical protein